MNIEVWEDGKEQYILNDEFVLKRADKLEFGIHETIYSGVDLELSYSWKKQTIDKIVLKIIFGFIITKHELVEFI